MGTTHMLDLMSHNARRTDALEYESKTFASYESRFRRLEEVVFKQASQEKAARR